MFHHVGITVKSMAKLAGVVLAFGLSLLATSSHAVPSFARQTGSDCAACHVGAFGPQLTPFGIKFKMGGYVDSDGKDGKAPLSGMVVANATRTAKDASEAVPSFKTNDNVAMQELSLFLAGKLTNNVGAFAQVTYSGIEKKTALDQFDLRYARTLPQGDKDLLLGVSLNGNPTLTDPLNTLGQWRFPYTSYDFGFGTGPGPIVEGLGGGVIGLNAYALWDQHFYGELGLYNSLSEKGIKLVGGSDNGKFKGLGTYARLGYMNDRKRDFFSVGLLGFAVGLKPDRTQTGVADRYRDLGIDASYQYLGNREHIVGVNGSYIVERQKLEFSEPGVRQTLKTLNASATNHHRQTWGGALGLFDARGVEDTRGYVLQADWTRPGARRAPGASRGPMCGWVCSTPGTASTTAAAATSTIPAPRAAPETTTSPWRSCGLRFEAGAKDHEDSTSLVRADGCHARLHAAGLRCG